MTLKLSAWIRALSVLAVSGTAFVAMKPAVSDADALVASQVLEVARFAGNDADATTACQYRCYNCLFFTRVYNTGSWPIPGDQHEESPCALDDCNEPCIVFPDGEPLLTLGDIKSLWNAVADSDLENVQSLLESTGRVMFNAERQAIQVLGCGDAVVAHIPLTDRQAATLALAN